MIYGTQANVIIRQYHMIRGNMFIRLYSDVKKLDGSQGNDLTWYWSPQMIWLPHILRTNITEKHLLDFYSLSALRPGRTGSWTAFSVVIFSCLVVAEEMQKSADQSRTIDTIATAGTCRAGGIWPGFVLKILTRSGGKWPAVKAAAFNNGINGRQYLPGLVNPATADIEQLGTYHLHILQQCINGGLYDLLALWAAIYCFMLLMVNNNGKIKPTKVTLAIWY